MEQLYNEHRMFLENIDLGFKRHFINSLQSYLKPSSDIYILY